MAGDNNTMHLLSEIKEGDFVDEVEKVISEADVNCIRWNPVFKNQFVSCGDDGVVNVWEVVFLIVCFVKCVDPISLFIVVIHLFMCF